ncbi:MAG: MBOAT family protein [Pseudomonadota bacterium]
MLFFPFSLLILPLAALLGVGYVRLSWGLSRVLPGARWRPARVVGTAVILTLTWSLPLLTRGPGPAQLTLGLLVGFLGIRMVALAERHRAATVPPTAGQVLAAMLTPEEVLAPVPRRAARPGATLAWGLAGVGACVGLLVCGNSLRLWHWSFPWARALDDLLVLIEVAVGAAGVDGVLVGVAGLAGRSVAGFFDHPIRSASLAEFWGRRWNRLVQGNLARAFFRPPGRRRRWARGTLAAFGASGVMHVLAVLDPHRLAITAVPSAVVMAFFLLHGLLVLAERRLGLVSPPRTVAGLRRARIRTIALFVALSPMLLDPFAAVVHLHGRSFRSPSAVGSLSSIGGEGSGCPSRAQTPCRDRARICSARAEVAQELRAGRTPTPLALSSLRSLAE